VLWTGQPPSRKIVILTSGRIPHFKHACFALLMVVCIIVVVYVSLESMVRRVDWPERTLIRDMRQIVAAPHDLSTYLSQERPVYGWDHETDLRFPPEGDPSCSGLRTVGDGLANSSISRPTISANKRGFWLTLMANEPILLCEGLANNAQDQPTLQLAPTDTTCPIKRSFHIVLETYPLI
jgi:hypothetical protein